MYSLRYRIDPHHNYLLKDSLPFGSDIRRGKRITDVVIGRVMRARTRSQANRRLTIFFFPAPTVSGNLYEPHIRPNKFGSAYGG
jgi:hypothetical protein